MPRHRTPEQVTQFIAGSFPGDLGIEPLEVTAERVVARLVVDRRHLHPLGYVHGGVWAAFGDTVAAWGTACNLEDSAFTTVELKANVLASAGPGDTLIAEGKPLHIGRRTQVWEVRISREERLAANFVCTQIVL